VTPDGTHDPCCSIAQAREVRRAEERQTLERQLRIINGALQTLDTECAP
jgi:hypothetical protein